ncbi:hypothetical protein ACP4J4_03780 [Aureimonas ureilytica]|uniref:hypothetical protein n=1 Tax=Aureimonas ureilytica TaxID=401562 RepID=UPI003CEA02E1
MAEELMTAERIEAGRTYLAALNELGFRPEGAMWSLRANEPETLELSLFSALVDRIGTGAIFDALFKAYEGAKTPRSFDPWLVGLYSPNQLFFKAIAGYPFEHLSSREGVAFLMIQGKEYEMRGQSVRIPESEIVRMVQPDWVYRVPEGDRSSPSIEIVRRWKRFEQMVREAA